MQDRAEGKIYVTWILIAANAIVFLVSELFGGSENTAVLVRLGAVVSQRIAAGETWRLFTGCFLHIGFLHLLSNMVSLFIFGGYMERAIGRGRYLLIYVLSGIAGNVLTTLWSLQTGDDSLSAGASGAIFGLLGALIVLALFRRERVAGMTPVRVIAVVILMLIPGFTTPDISITAHIGGLLGGMFFTLLLLPTFRRSGR